MRTLFSKTRLIILALYLAMIVLAPLVSPKGYWLSLLCQIGIATIFALSYNMLLGQTGLLSFGHAVYFGLGGFATIHLLRAVQEHSWPFPITLLPLAGGVAGLLFAVALGYVTTRRAGTTFAMISLGIGEMVAASSLMFPAFFGGEAGISSNRVTAPGWFGVSYGPQLQMYYLIAGWAFLCIVAMYALTDTPLGRMANAVRDNPERAEFVGFDPQWVRYLMVVLAGFFAGVAGGLTALNYEIVTAETLSAATSGIVIMMAFVGGIGQFAGPIVGAALITVLQIAVASITAAWPFYFGLLFTVIVLYAPGGIAGIVADHKRLHEAGQLRHALQHYLLALVPFALCTAGLITLVEMAYALANSSERGSAPLHVFGVALNAARPLAWALPLIAVAMGALLLRSLSRRMTDQRSGEVTPLQERQA
ncbi:MAG TPA: branched-chain amino acid ABC transporter permease [Myxococcales bacterium]|nr:branched-chain amino acid ABC transporter permease [Myxococcales bacterium]